MITHTGEKPPTNAPPQLTNKTQIIKTWCHPTNPSARDWLLIATDATIKAAKKRDLMAAQKRVAPQSQRVLLSTCDKGLDRVGREKTVTG